MAPQQHSALHSAGRARTRILRHTVALAAFGALAGAQAQQSPDAPQADANRPWTFEPSVSLRQTFTDNRDLLPVKASDSITELGAGLRLGANRGRVRGYLDYALTGSVHARRSAPNEILHNLGAAATAELIEGMAFVDLRASYSRQAISAFGAQAPSGSLTDNNRSDVGSLALAPSLRGRFGGDVRYEARADLQTVRAKGSDAADVDTGSVSLRLDSGAREAGLGWFANASHAVTDYRAGRNTFDTRLRAGLSYTFGADWRLGVNVGRERTDLTVIDGKSSNTWGLQAEWTPTPRTNVAANAEHRFFGNAHSVSVSHRTPLSVWAFSDSRDIADTSARGVGSFGSAYDLFFRQFASTEPDETKRDALVRNYLRTNGIDPNSSVVGGFLASAVTLKRAQTASVALVGARNTVTLQLNASRDERADKVATVIDDLTTSGVVRQRGLRLDWAYRLTPLSSLSLAAGYQRNEGDVSTLRSTLKSWTALWTGPLGPRGTFSAGLRRADFESLSAPYEENAVFAALRLAF